MSCLPVAVVVFSLIGAASAAAAAPPTIAAADLRVTFVSARHCRAVVRYATAGTAAGPLDHRLRVEDGAEVSGPWSRGELLGTTRLGQTLSVLAAPDADGSYDLTYDVRQPPSGDFRCPLWLPAVPTSGGPTGVTLAVRLPEDATAIGTAFPSLRFEGRDGRVSLRDLPSFVRAPFRAPGVKPAWTDAIDAGRLTDGLTVAALAAASVVWLWWRRR